MPALIDDLRRYVHGAMDGEQFDAFVERVEKLVAAYDALAPTPEQWRDAPAWAEWYAINANGVAEWNEAEPYCDDGEGACWCMVMVDDRLSNTRFCGHVNLPPGLDWRECIWRRPGGEPQP